MGTLITFFCFFVFFFWERAISIGPSTNLLEHWALPNGSTSLDTCHKIETNVLPYISPFWIIYMGVQLWANPGAIGNILGNAFGNTLGTWWEHVKNTLGTKGEIKVPLPAPPQKDKTAPFLRACWALPMPAWNSSFQNCVSPSLASANGRCRILET